MKSFTFSLLATLFLSFSLSAGSVSKPCCFASNCPLKAAGISELLPVRTAKLAMGTIIYFEATSTTNSREVSVGAVVPFRVTTDVRVGKHTVIASGTQAMGRVKKVTKATFNNPEVIEIEVKHVQAIDGSQVALSTNPIRIKGTFPGQGVTVDAYTAATSTVMNDTEVQLKN